MIIGIDPSSTCTGYCVMNERSEIQVLGRWKSNDKDALERVARMQLSLGLLFNECPGYGRLFPNAVVEIPGPPVRKKSAQGNVGMAHSGYMNYCFAVGAIWTVARLHCANVMTVKPSKWTRTKTKRKRAELLAIEYPEHANVILADGYDAADALGLALWGLGELKKRQAKDV